MVEITNKPLSPENVVNAVKTEASGCVVTYVGLIRNTSRGKSVSSVEYLDEDRTAVKGLQTIENEIRQKWHVENVAIVHRIGMLKVGDINLVVAISAGHRQEGFAACQYAIDRFKEIMPARKTETYTDGSKYTGD